MTQRPRPSSALFTLAAIVTAVAALHVAREILLPIALATLFSFLLAPLADRLERLRIGRIPSVLAVVGVAFLVLGLLGWVVTSQLVDLSNDLPKFRDNIIAKVKTVTSGSQTFEGVTQTIEDVTEELAAEEEGSAKDGGDQQSDATTDASVVATGPPADEANDAAGSEPLAGDEASRTEQFAAWAERVLGGRDGKQTADGDGVVSVKVVSMPPSPLQQMQTWMGPLMAPLTAAGMVVVLVLFMLLQREDQRNRLIRLFGSSNIHATTEALTDVVDRVSRYLRMQFLINAGYGLCVGLGLAVIGVPNAVMFGVLSFSLRFLPYIGPWISAVLPIAVSMAISDGWTQTALVAGWFVILELVVNNVVEPLLYGSSIGVSGMGVILAAIFWTWLWGPVGLVLAMPLTVCMVVMARYVPALRFITVLLGDQQSLAVEERIYQRMLALDDLEIRELADEALETMSRTDFYDQALIPALRLAERDRHDGDLSEDQEQAIHDLARDLIAEVGERSLPAEDATADAGDATASEQPPEPAGRARVLCVPLRDEADKTAALMLGQLLEAAQITAIVTPVESLTSETVDAVAESDVDLVVVSVLPPLPVRTSRLLCRRLRKRYPTLPIVVGFWDGAPVQESHQLLASKDDGEILTTLSSVVDRARAIASRAPRADQPIGGKQEVAPGATVPV